MENAKNLYDVVIVGGGPAGLSAAIYIARARYRVLVVEKETIGGQITITSEVVNYPGVKRASGRELTESMRLQAQAFGAEFAIAEVMGMELEKDIKVLHTTRGDIECLGVVLAIGANPRKLGFKGEKEFQGRGVAYCATCDGEFFTGKEVFVIGGGFAAVEEGIFLTKYASHVTMIVREADFTCAKTVADEVKRHSSITVKFNTEIMEVSGQGMVSRARFRNNVTGEEWEHQAGEKGSFGVFVFAGYVPNTAWMGGAVALDERGYIITDASQKTSLDGVYAAGDVCIKNLRQVVTAVSDGAVAATSLEKHVAALHDKLGLPPFPRPEADKSQLTGKEAPASHETKDEGQTAGFLTPEIKAQLGGIFPKFQNKVHIRAWLDESPLSGEVSSFLGEMEDLTDKLICSRQKAPEEPGRLIPSLELCYEDGASSGIEFHGVPGGHEFNSFILALYNVAGPGQPMEDGLRQRLSQVSSPVNVKVLVSLSCTMCPEVVQAAMRAASLSPAVTAEMVDLMHYPQLKEKYQVMSVPCLIVNDSEISFGKKNLEQVADIICKNA